MNAQLRNDDTNHTRFQQSLLILNILTFYHTDNNSEWLDSLMMTRSSISLHDINQRRKHRSHVALTYMTGKRKQL